MFFNKNIKIGNISWAKKDLSIDDGLGGIKIIEGIYYYTWEAANRVVSKINGWHIPSHNEFIDSIKSTKVNEKDEIHRWLSHYISNEFNKKFGYIEGCQYEFNHVNLYHVDKGYYAWGTASYWCSDICKEESGKDSPYPYYVLITKKDISIKRMYKTMCMRIRLVKD